MSEKLSNLYNPVTKKTYKPLLLNDKFWKYKFNQDIRYKSKYNTKSSQIFGALYLMNIKFNAIQELLYQSNPSSFDPITFYKQKTTLNLFKIEQLSEDEDDNVNDGQLYICLDYDDFDDSEKDQ